MEKRFPGGTPVFAWLAGTEEDFNAETRRARGFSEIRTPRRFGYRNFKKRIIRQKPA
jgi:hypothetical protein